MQVKVCWSVRKGGKWFAFPNVEFRSVLSRVTRPSNTSTPLDRGCRASCQHAKSCVERSSAVPSNPSSILLPLSQLMCSIRQFPTLSGSLSTFVFAIFVRLCDRLQERMLRARTENICPSRSKLVPENQSTTKLRHSSLESRSRFSSTARHCLSVLPTTC